MKSLTVIFSFIVFMIILNKGHLFFFDIFSLLMVAVISLGVGFGMAAFTCTLIEGFSGIFSVVLVIAAIVIIVAVVGRGGK